jgi:hypothetical protein
MKTLTATIAVLATLVVATPAHAGDRDVIRRGDCTGLADWKLKVGPEDGRLEVEGEIDSNRAGQRWTWVLRHNGTQIASGVRYTAGASGSFEVRRVPRDLAGRDTFVFRAVRPATGQVCRGTVSF